MNTSRAMYGRLRPSVTRSQERKEMNCSHYVLVTAARDEEEYIAETIRSVISQTVLPAQWVIVSDGSIDRTDEIVKQFAAQFDFIRLLRIDTQGKPTYASKARAIRQGYEQVRSIPHDYVGILDADVTFGSNYYESVLKRFDEDSRLGLAGGILFDRRGAKYVRQLTTMEWSVSGPIQMFRRQCFEDIGGYLPVRAGVDAVAEVMSRMHGWVVRSFPHPEMLVLHHRETASRGSGLVKRFFRSGQQSYRLGYHFLFLLGRCLNRAVHRPYVLGSVLSLCGYCWSWMTRSAREVPPEFVAYLRAEQLGRIRSALGGALAGGMIHQQERSN